MSTAAEIRSILASTLQIGERASALDSSSPLLGSIPELDSMAVVSLLTALEDRFGILIEDDEISSENLATFGALVRFVEGKVNA